MYVTYLCHMTEIVKWHWQVLSVYVVNSILLLLHYTTTLIQSKIPYRQKSIPLPQQCVLLTEKSVPAKNPLLRPRQHILLKIYFRLYRSVVGEQWWGTFTISLTLPPLNVFLGDLICAIKLFFLLLCIIKTNLGSCWKSTWNVLIVTAMLNTLYLYD
jgi:hypothetical protein